MVFRVTLPHSLNRDSAVSPVIGVMLILIVTVLVAAVIGVFASGVLNEVDPASKSTIVLDDYVMGTVTYGWGSYTTDPTYSSSFDTTMDAGGYVYVDNSLVHEYKESSDWSTNYNYGIYKMVFTHKGGEPIDINGLVLTISANQISPTTPVTAVLSVQERIKKNGPIWYPGEELVLDLNSNEELLKYNSYSFSSLVLGLGRNNMNNNKFEWNLKDASGFTIAYGTEDAS